MKNFFPSRAVSCPVLFCCCSFNLKIKPYNKSFIDQACSVKMAGYWPCSFFAFLWTSTSSRSIKTQKKELGQYPAILTSRLVNNAYVFMIRLTLSSPGEGGGGILPTVTLNLNNLFDI